MKKIISFVLSLTVVISAVFCINSMFASAATTGSCGDNNSNVTFSYDETTKTLTITGTGAIKNFGTTGLNKTPWYDYRQEIQSVVIGDGVTTIGQLAFFYCTSLQSVTLPTSLVEISGGTANYGAFRDCSALEAITLPEGITTIGAMAFRNCTALKSITFPNSLTSLGNYAFQSCSALKSVTYGTGMTESGSYAFYETGINRINFSSTITRISQYSFYGTMFTTIELPDQITSIGTRAFANCSFISDVTVNNTNCSFEGVIGEDPFNGSSQAITFYGHSASTTQAYAENKGYTFVSIDPCEHETTHEVITLYPTCTETGISTQVCDNCGFVVSTETINANGHSYELINELDETEQNGHIFKDYRCTECGDEYSQITHVANVEGFYEYENTATCTRPGMEIYTCTLEGCGNVERRVSSSGNHSIDEYTQQTEPTCTESGMRVGVCTKCEQTITETIPATGHTNEFLEVLDNVEEDGHTYNVEQCTVCNEQTLTPTHVEWVDGNYTSTVLIQPTCTINGVQVDRCTICSQTRNVTLEANGEHVWYVTATTEPTCTSSGKIYYACENCDMTKSENVEALGHQYEAMPESSVAPTCTAAGYDLYKCSVCGSVKKDVISALGHTPDEETYTVVSEPDCENEGLATATCANCGIAMNSIVLPALGHDYEDVVTPITEKPGHTLTTPVCQRCGNTDIATLQHAEWMYAYTQTQVVTEGSCTVARVERDSCTLCGETRTRTTNAPGHDYSFTDVDVSTGNLVYTCANCNGTASRTPSTVLLAWNSRCINKAPAEISGGYMFELSNDGVLNAKDYAQILKANNNSQQTD